MEVTKENIREILKGKELSAFEISTCLETDDVDLVMALIAELEFIDEEVMMGKQKTCYEPDGCAFYITQYKLVRNQDGSKNGN